MFRPPPPRTNPRMSANELARYMVSSHTGAMGIIRRAKNPQTPLIIRYRDVRQPICSYLSDSIRNLNPLISAELMLQQRATDSAETPFRQDDARQSIEVIHAIQGMSNQLREFDFQAAPTNQNRLTICGVEISVKIDLLVHATVRGRDHIGCAILRMTQDDAETDDARERRRNMGILVATIARMHLEKNIQPSRQVSNRLCMSIDVQHGEIFAAPQGITRRVQDIENACRFIAAAWPTV